MTNPNSQNKSLLITGATGGMGRACAEMAAERGYTLVLADLLPERLREVADACATHGAQPTTCVLDVTDESSVSALLDQLAARGGIDSIIHTVGVSPHMAPWDKILTIDLIQSVAFLERARQHLADGGGAVCISSMSAYLAPENAQIDALLASLLEADTDFDPQAVSSQAQELEHPGLAYSYAKRALRDWVARQSSVWGGEGKRLTSISPGLINTSQGQLESEAMGTEQFERMRAGIALQRLGEPEDIARVALFLISDEGAYITGCDHLVDGGFVARARQAGKR